MLAASLAGGLLEWKLARCQIYSPYRTKDLDTARSGGMQEYALANAARLPASRPFRVTNRALYGVQLKAAMQQQSNHVADEDHQQVLDAVLLGVLTRVLQCGPSACQLVQRPQRQCAPGAVSFRAHRR